MQVQCFACYFIWYCSNLACCFFFIQKHHGLGIIANSYRFCPWTRISTWVFFSSWSYTWSYSDKQREHFSKEISYPDEKLSLQVSQNNSFWLKSGYPVTTRVRIRVQIPGWTGIWIINVAVCGGSSINDWYNMVEKK